MTSSISAILQTLRIVAPDQPHAARSRLDAAPLIALDEVARHDTFDDCWIVVYDRVYDVTGFLHAHPGGQDVIMDHAGRDATLAFHGTGHSSDAIAAMRDLLIGELPPKQRIFRTPDGCGAVLSTGVPE